METISKLILCVIPNETCNLKCDYCYISQLNGWGKKTSIPYKADYIANCLSKERLGGTSLINLTAMGETLLVDGIVDIVRALLTEGHYVEIVTNGLIRKRIDELLALDINILKRLFFKVSFHYAELIRINKIDDFFDNVRAIQESAASFSLELMANDSIENDIEEIMDICKKNVKAVCHATIGRNDTRKDKALLSHHSKEAFYEKWKKLDSQMLDFKVKALGDKRKEFCYAGGWSMVVNLATGDTQQCYWQPIYQNIYKDPKTPLKFRPVGHFCSMPYCMNAHSLMTWGIIPEIETPSYCDMRDRVCTDGSNWIKGEFREFSRTKLYVSNRVCSGWEKLITAFGQCFFYFTSIIKHPSENIKKVRKILKRK